MKKLFIFLFSILSMFVIGYTQTAGPNYPASVVDDASTGAVSWVNPINASTDNTTYSNVSLSSGQITHYLKATNFGFTIPSTATITGITVEIERYEDANNKLKDNAVYLLKSGAIVGTNASTGSNWPNSVGVITYGGTTNLWGTTWTPIDINNANFGVVLSAIASGNVNGYVDYIRVSVTYSMPPGANDECTTATLLTVGTSCTYSTYTLTGATNSTTTPLPTCASYSTACEDVWFKVVVPTCGRLIFDTQTGVVTDGGMAIYSGTCGSLTQIECDDDDSPNGMMPMIDNATLTPGSTVYIRVWEYGGDVVGDFGICVYDPLPPCSGTPNAGTVTAGTNPLTCAATTSLLTATNLSTGCGITYQWQSAPAAGGPWTNITGQTGTTTTVSAAGYYRIFTTCSNGGGTNSSTPLQITSTITPPANDNCAGAVTLTINSDLNCGIVTAGTTLCATNSGTAACIGSGADDDVWYKFVATNTQLAIEIQNVSGTTDCVHEIFSGTCASLTSIGCSDPETSEWTGLTVGNTYYLRVYTYFTGSNSQFNVCLGTPPPPPSNDEPCGAIPLNVTNGSCSYQSGMLPTSATISSGMAAPGCGSLAEDVWYSAVVPASGRLIVDIATAGGPTDLDMAWYTGPNCGNLNNLVECDDADSQNGSMAMICRTGTICTVPGNCQQNATLSPGATVYIRIWDYAGGTFGPFDICAYDPGPAGAPSTCASATNITALPFYHTGQTTCCRGNEYTSANSTSPTNDLYQDGEDYLYTYTPATTGTVDIMLTGTLTYTGVFVFNKCPSAGGVACVAESVSSTGNPMLCGVSLTAGTTYYIMIDTDPTPNCTPFNISVLSSTAPTCGLNYTISSITYAPDLNNGTNIVLPIDDRFSSSYIPIGFPFCFDGYQFTQLLVSSNGYVIFDPISCASNLPTTNAAPGAWSEYSIEAAVPNTTDAPRNSIMFPWQDINPATGGTIKYQVLGTAPNRRFVLTFTDVPYYSCSSLLFTGQLKLFETSYNIEIHLDNKEMCSTWTSSYPGAGILGLHNYNGTIAQVPAGYNFPTQWTANNKAWRFTCNCVGCVVPLPVELMTFTGNRVNDIEIELKWSTASETNNNHFEVQKLIDNEFQTIGIVPGSGNSNEEICYQYVDYNANSDVQYYRLKQVDHDGQFEYSKVIKVSEILNYKDGITVYPNPASEDLNITINFNGIIQKIILVDINGKEVIAGLDYACDDVTKITLPISKIESGIYMLKFESTQGEFYYKNKVVIKK